MGKTIGIIAIKGGVGKTTSVANLASALANFDKKVLVVDANFSAPNSGIHFGVLDPKITIHDVMLRRAKLSQAIIKTEHGFDLVAGKLNFNGKIDYTKLKQELATAKKDYDYVLIDSSPNLNNEMLATIMASDALFVVTTPDYPTLSCTLHAVKMAKQKKTPIAGLILNRVYNKNFELSVNDIEEAAECPVVAVIPHDVHFLEALSKTTPSHALAPNKAANVEYAKLAAAISGEAYSDPRFFASLKNIFGKSQPKQDLNRALIKDNIDVSLF